MHRAEGWTSSLRPKGLGEQGGEQVGEEKLAQDEPETSPTPLQTLTPCPRQEGGRAVIVEVVPGMKVSRRDLSKFSSLHPLALETPPPHTGSPGGEGSL